MRKLIIIVISLVILFFVFNSGDEPVTLDHPAVHVPEGWSAPELVPVSDKGWEDGVFISQDGTQLYFTYYPGKDLIADVASGSFEDDLDVYVSQLQDGTFKTKQLLTDYYLSEDLWSEGGVMIDSQGNIFYDSNREWARDQESDTDIFMNDKLLPFNDDEHRGNPHYCEALDELYMSDDDKSIYVMRDAVASDFTAPIEKLPAPINIGGTSTQPFLTDDCQTMYFTTNRGDLPVTGPAIYKTERTPNQWSTPTPIIWAETGVGEPTIANNNLYFLLLIKTDGGVTSDIYVTMMT